jgi:hypothetical protein
MRKIRKILIIKTYFISPLWILIIHVEPAQERVAQTNTQITTASIWQRESYSQQQKVARKEKETPRAAQAVPHIPRVPREVQKEFRVQVHTLLQVQKVARKEKETPRAAQAVPHIPRVPREVLKEFRVRVHTLLQVQKVVAQKAKEAPRAAAQVPRILRIRLQVRTQGLRLQAHTLLQVQKVTRRGKETRRAAQVHRIPRVPREVLKEFRVRVHTLLQVQKVARRGKEAPRAAARVPRIHFTLLQVRTQGLRLQVQKVAPKEKEKESPRAFRMEAPILIHPEAQRGKEKEAAARNPRE